MPLREWKKLVNNIVKDFDYRSIQAFVRKRDNETISQWWGHCYYVYRVTKILIFIVKLLLQIGRLYIKRCKLRLRKMSVKHILFEFEKHR